MGVRAELVAKTAVASRAKALLEILSQRPDKDWMDELAKELDHGADAYLGESRRPARRRRDD